MDELIQEKQHLKKIVDLINDQLKLDDKRKAELKKEIIEERARIWDDLSKGAYDIATEMQDVTTDSQADYLRAASYDRIEQRKNRLIMLHDNPYFARIDFKENGYDEVETYYIGACSFSNDETSEIYVCDWRADISSLFYEQGLGPVSYTTTYETINGDLSLRRQFKIENAELKYMFDSDVAIEDDILQNELAKDSDLKLKTIVSTIQKEQNKIIRDISGDILLVQGVAGSGKTSIALHRLAYLLYKYRNSLTADSIIIFSPNNVFNGYIADVLPALGEQKAVQKSFHELFASFFPQFSFETPVEYHERMLAEEDKTNEHFKTTEEFASVLRSVFMEETAVRESAPAITFKNTTLMKAEEVLDRYNNWYKNFPPANRIQKIKNTVMEDFENNCKDYYLASFIKKMKRDEALDFTDEEEVILKNNEWERALKEMERKIDRLLQPDLLAIYKKALAKGCPEAESYTGISKNAAGSVLLDYTDLFPMTYLGILSGAVRPMRKIAHCVIDEAQDYPPILYRIINSLFPMAKLTILGDISQKTSDIGLSIDKIEDYFTRKTVFYKLTRSYRSTSNINSYLKSVEPTKAEGTDYFERNGEDVSFISSSAEDITSAIEELISSGHKSNAIICKDRAECHRIKDILGDKIKATVIGEDNIIYPRTTVIIPSYLTKGLEFDGVVVVDKDGTFSSKAKGLYYVACSRALHKLYVANK